MRFIAWSGVLALTGSLVGCVEVESVEPQGSVWTSVQPNKAPPNAYFDLEDQGRDAGDDGDEDAAEPLTDEAIARGLGLDASSLPPAPAPESIAQAPDPEVLVESTPAPMGLPSPQVALARPEAAPPGPAWTPEPQSAGSWGFQVISTLRQTNPPRAILGLPDGTEQVVQAGTMLPDARLVVLAIGENRVQVAEVTPEGDRARVQTYVVEALYAGTSRSLSPPAQ